MGFLESVDLVLTVRSIGTCWWGLYKVRNSSCTWLWRFVAMFQIELVSILAHCFRLKLGTAEPALVFGVVSLSAEGAMEIVLFNSGGGGRVLSVKVLFLKFLLNFV